MLAKLTVFSLPILWCSQSGDRPHLAIYQIWKLEKLYILSYPLEFIIKKWWFGIFVLLPSIMGKIPNSHSIHVQNPTKSPFSNKTWCGGSKYVMEGKIKWPFNLLMFNTLASYNSWKVNEGIRTPLWNGMFTKTFQTKRISNNQLS
jgi:hypothetical protein